MADLIARFTSSIRTGVTPLTVTFTNTSSGGFTSCLWDFGDGSTSSEINPTHQFLTTGTFNVVLTVYTVDGVSSSYTGTITVFAQGDTTDNPENQYGLFVSKRFSPGEVNVLRQSLQGSTFESWYPLTGQDSISGLLGAGMAIEVPCSGLNGAYVFKHNGNTGIETNLISGGSSLVGSRLFFMFNDSGNTSPSTWNNVYDYGTSPQHLVGYTIVSANTTTDELWVDKPLPLRTTDADGQIYAYAFISASDGGDYDWFKTESQRRALKQTNGIDYANRLEADGWYTYDTTGKGVLSYLGYTSQDGIAPTIISPYWTAVTLSDAFYPGSIELYLPTIMWHENASNAGMVLTDSIGDVERDESTNMRFKYLRTNYGSNPVGKVFYDNKMIVITDPELNVALDHSSFRNYTLAPPTVSVGVPSGGDFSTATTYYVTYRLYEDGSSAADGTSFGLGTLKPMHCRDIQSITPTTEDSQLRVFLQKSPWQTDTPADGTGFTVGYGCIDIIIGTGTSTQVDVSSYKYSALTSYDVDTLVATGVLIDEYAKMLDYDVSGEPISGTSEMAHFSDLFCFGYLSGSLETNIYKMATTCVAKNNEFNTSQNETFDSATNASTYITEVALYNEKNELLLYGKLNKPIEKNEQKYVTIKVELDL